jgi:hypothetical protein
MPLEQAALDTFLGNVRNGLVSDDDFRTTFALCSPPQRLLAQKARPNGPLMNALAAQPKYVRANPQQQLDAAAYKVLASHNDPTLPVFKRNHEIGNFWYWFGTFWKEMKEEHRRDLLALHFTTAGELVGANAHLDTKNTDALTAPQQEAARALLRGMMDKGFTPWEQKSKTKPGPTKGKKLLPKIDALGKQLKAVGFRGDARDLETLAKHDGGAFLSKSQSAYQVGKYNMEKEWNPFSDQVVRNTMYFREGQADNDLFTVVSVAKDFATSSKFPLIDDPPSELRTFVDGATVEFEHVASKTRETRSVTVTTSFVYMVIADEGYNTEAEQVSKFPEIGVKSIPKENFLATLDVVRLHFGRTGDDGHLVYVADFHFINGHTRKLLHAQDKGDDAVKRFGDYLTSTYYRKMFMYNPLNVVVPKRIEACPHLPLNAVSTFNRGQR